MADLAQDMPAFTLPDAVAALRTCWNLIRPADRTILWDRLSNRQKAILDRHVEAALRVVSRPGVSISQIDRHCWLYEQHGQQRTITNAELLRLAGMEEELEYGF